MTDEFASTIAFTRDFDIGREILLTFMQNLASLGFECYKTISNFYDRAWKQSYTSIGANRTTTRRLIFHATMLSTDDQCRQSSRCFDGRVVSGSKRTVGAW